MQKEKQKYDGCVLAILIKKNYFLDEKKDDEIAPVMLTEGRSLYQDFSYS